MPSLNDTRHFSNSTSPAPRGRRLAAVAIIALPILLSTTAQPVRGQPPEESPYDAGRHNPSRVMQQHPYASRAYPEQNHRRPSTGLRLQHGTTLLLTFGHDYYQDGATLAAIIQGLEEGERLSIERTASGALLRRLGGEPGSAYDFLQPGPGSTRERP